MSEFRERLRDSRHRKGNRAGERGEYDEQDKNRSDVGEGCWEKSFEPWLYRPYRGDHDSRGGERHRDGIGLTKCEADEQERDNRQQPRLSGLMLINHSVFSVVVCSI
ncbi:hypothetical protein [Methylocystis echinoides]|uniref:Uncharacterized protein n=1 Tax=Methylocystis echinoides TaxID=29468 RepID=A0A9W6LUA6_9HYPH|nr:hypothetical protein [Methylocystis echinoides]GLI95453.1 hypothetical protein LMG27198_44450 [Methylocystis echinoides]